ncbi:cytochrome c peroxidase [Neorhodopirellula pilleata]|nr:cytochrome c peroxidase [Neorhodopirellula pilleata]
MLCTVAMVLTTTPTKAEPPSAREVEIQDLVSANHWLRYVPETDRFFGIHHTEFTWEESEVRARTVHEFNGAVGRLASIRNQQENAAVYELSRAYRRDVWLAGTDIGSEGTWRWAKAEGTGAQFWKGAANGQPVGGAYANFAAGEPNNYAAGQHHLKMYWWSGSWDDESLGRKMGYVVEWDAADVVGPDVASPPPALSSIPVPLPKDLDHFVKDRSKAIALGKALFWDMQVGSDGRTACATCHAPAGIDQRLVNVVNPGAPGSVFGPQRNGQAELLADAIAQFKADNKINTRVNAADFPLSKLEDDTRSIFDNRLVRDSKQVFGSAGVVRKDFVRINEGSPIDEGSLVFDPVFNLSGANARQVTARDTPTTINAVFFDRLFWDGRANHHFNGVNPFGDLDPTARVLKHVKRSETKTTWGWYRATARYWWFGWRSFEYWAWGPTQTTVHIDNLEPTKILLNNAALASQAVGPPLSGVEMSWHGRDFKEIGRKMLLLRALALQNVHPTDSVLANFRHGSANGLNQNYSDLVREAFVDHWWSSPNVTDEGYTQMESNFSLFWGLSLMLYQSTLVSDDAPYDRWANGDESALSESAKRGLKLFLNEGKCINCHGGPEFAGATISDIRNGDSIKLIERMVMGNGEEAWYDNGFYNIGVRPTLEDIAVGADHPTFGPLSYTKQRQNGRDIGQSDTVSGRITVDGGFKTPTLRNIELTGPYFHTGGYRTLKETVEFYVRGGTFWKENQQDIDPDVDGIPELQDDADPQGIDDIVNFMKSLTDDRVRFQKAPFDHPELIVPDGHSGVENGIAKDVIIQIPAVGRDGGERIRAFEEIVQ